MSPSIAAVLALTVAGLTGAARLHAQAPPYLNDALPIATRVDDLVSRMTLAEKVSQMKDVAPAIDRLGIPAYNWWNEALHGVARSGLATVFPQAIGIAATWNEPLVFRMATAISGEGRAKYHEYVRNNSRQRYQGLTFWSPNINLFRDPRWGRGQETYGEDPYLTGRLAIPFIRGLQGDDPKYFKTVATVKHFAVHSGPEPERHEFDAIVNERDYRESYLPQFDMGIREAGAYSLMCAYNRLEGLPACSSKPLLQDLLRGEWKFPGFIVSDCGAIDDIYLRHKVVATAAEAAASAVKAGTDLDCGRVYPNLVEAVGKGLITEAEIDVSVRRLFVGRFRLGMFDPQEKVRWASTPFSLLDQPSHRALARTVAHESLVLLKNAGAVLPLRKDLGTIAVIGPNANEPRMLLGNYNGEPADPVTPLRGIREAVSRTTRVLHARGSDLADGFPTSETVPASAFSTPDGQRGLRAQFFASSKLDSLPRASRTDTTLAVNWEDRAPSADLPADAFSVRWSGMLRPPMTGLYRLGLNGTMRFRMLLDDSVVVVSRYPQRDGEFPDPRAVQTPPIRLEAGRSYRLVVEANETYGDAQLEMLWSTPSDSLKSDAVRVARQADAVVMFLGLAPRLEGEEMPITIDGFRGGDRTRIDLPAPQQRLLEAVVALRKPTVVVLLNGSALAVNWADANVPAILEAWYPGQAGGTAIADALFGDYNPGGRLPVTFYRAAADLPSFENYDMAGRTYKYFNGVPLYPFGHGLSYTTFRYGRPQLSAPSLRAGDTLTVRVAVTNTGRRDGDEVVQLYTRHASSRVSRPRRELRGFARVPLKAGETRTVTLRVPASHFAYWDTATHAWKLESAPVNIELGSSSSDIRQAASVRVVAPR